MADRAKQRVAIFWKMHAGMGGTSFAQCYQLLSALGDRSGADRCVRLALVHARANGAVALERRAAALTDRLTSRPVAA